MNFGDILRELIELHDLSQKDFAEKFNIAPSTLGNYVNDNREPDYNTLIKFADFFGVSIDYLLNHHIKETHDHQEDELLHIFRSLSPQMKEILLSISCTILKCNEK